MVKTFKEQWNNGGRLNIYAMALNFLLGSLFLVLGWSINSTLDSIRQDTMETRESIRALKVETRENLKTIKGEHRADVCRLDGRIDRAEDRLNVMGGVKWKP